MQPDPEFSSPLLMSATFGKLHRAIVKIGPGGIGVSFPLADKTPGDCIRVHGSKQSLEELMHLDWLRGMKDYVYTSGISEIPKATKYRIISRFQPKSSVERMYRRSVNKGWISLEEAEKKCTDISDSKIKLPYLEVKSQSSGQRYRLFFKQGNIVNEPRDGEFSSYGLSTQATVPWF